MSGRSSFLSHPWRVLRWTALAAAVPAVWACTSRTLETPTVTPTQTFSNKVVQKVNNNIDILFMVDNSSSMTQMQTKLLAQLPNFMTVLQGLPMGLPSVQIAVVSSDMGAPSDSDVGCGAGNAGAFQVMPEGSCVATTLNAGAQFITDDAQGTTKNFSMPDPAGIASVFSCIALLGSTGCGFEHQLASIDRALGSDSLDGAGKPQPPASNVGFLRDGAYLGIVMLTNEDDCSAPGNTSLFSLNGGQQSINNPLGPIANYRCNQFGHVCSDAGGPLAPPPLNPPADAAGNPPAVTLANCQSSEDSGMLTPVSTFVQHIKALKPDPANQILVAAVTGPTDPYTVEWLPGTGASSSELWPAIEHACTSQNGDGSFADPSVRITQFVKAFGTNGVLASICDNSYQSSMVAIANKIGALIKPKCIVGTIQQNAAGNPNCTVTNEVQNNGITANISVPSCIDQPGAAPCWNLIPSGGIDPITNMPNNCPAGTSALSVSADPNNPMPQSLDSVIECSTCIAGVAAPGCP